jgi:4'-phosphopantetheinyl transferase
MEVAEGEIDVWRVALSPVGEVEFAVLSAEERERAERTRSEAAREAFVACRAALRRILGVASGQRPEAVRLIVSREGKPDFEERPGGLHFNVSHSGSTGLVALRRGGPVGVDVEEVREVVDAAGVARRFFQREEVAALEGWGYSSRAFLGVWTRKEAVAKALGSGLAGVLGRFAVGCDPDDAAPAVVWKGEAPGRLEVRTLALAGCVGAVAAWGGPELRRVLVRDWPGGAVHLAGRDQEP